MVPADIVDYILSLLHSDGDYTTLETCSLVFPQFVDRHLYSHITLDIVHPGGLVPILPLRDIIYYTYRRMYYILDPTNFLRILADRPHVANYVRLVQIIIGGRTIHRFKFIPEQLRDRISFTSSILSILPHPESILIVAYSIRTMSWHRLGPEFSTAVQNSIRLPSIKSVAIFDVKDFSLEIFDSCKNLENLILDYSFLHGDSVSTSSYPRLRSLHIVRYDNLTRVVSWLKSNTLHTLSLRLYSNAVPDISTLIKACSTTLVNLDINHIHYSGDALSTIPDLHLPFLDHLTFHSSLDKLCALPSLVRFLGSIKTISRLSPVQLTLHLSIHRRDIKWSLVTPILTLPIFRHPIEIYFTDTRVAPFRQPTALNVLERNSDMKRFLEAETFVAIMNEEW